MAEQGNNNPQTLLKVYMAFEQKQEKYLFLTTETWQKTKIFLIFHGRNKVTTNPDPTQGLYGVIGKRRKNIYF